MSSATGTRASRTLADRGTPEPSSLAARFRAVRELTDRLAEPLSPEDQQVQTMPDVSPTKWHRAHTTWFFETFVLGPYVPGYEAFDPAFGYLFNSYYEAAGPRLARNARGLLSRPSGREVAAYRRHVDTAVLAALEDVLPDAALPLVDLGLHHEQQHQELLLMDAKHVLGTNPLFPAYRELPAAPAGAAAPMGFTPHQGGLVEIGHDGDGFAFDNESPRHRVHLEPFALADRLVTNAEWVAFVDEGGYRRAELWLSDGWAAVQAEQWRAPLYWQHSDDGWSVVTLGGLRPLDLDEPVCHVSYYEADAFARWAGARLPTEAEWEVVAGAVPTSPSGFLDLDVLHPRAATGAGTDHYGQVWQWTASPYSAYPGFRPASGAVGEYNGKFMVNQQVLRGGCCVTPPGHVRPSYRNFFPPGARWVFSGVRLARDS